MSKKRRMIVIAGLVMAMTSATVPAMVMAGCNNKQTTPSNKQIEGEYYSESDNFMLRLYETDYAFEMYVNGVKKTGVYTFKSNTLTLTITGDGTVIVATVNSDKTNISLKYNGKDYDLATTSLWTLSFNTDGAAAIDSQLVANGKHGVRPADPSKGSSYLFVGWYESDMTTPFDFNAALTADKTAYARFVAIDATADNFTVTFNAGTGATLATTTATTVNGRIYNAPVPTKAGSTFVGWWVSHYGTADKLTYKYNEQVLKEDTTFYAVWDTDLNGAPAVSVTSSGVSWTASGVANQYTVVIYNSENVKVVDTQTGSTSYTYDFTTKAAGDYKIEVTLSGKTTTAYFKNKPLDKVTGFDWEGSVLTFDAVQNATDYYITVECGNAAHVHSEIHLTERKYDFSACEMKVGGIKFIIEARAEGYITSFAEFFIEKNLDDITGLEVDPATETLKWNAVENATSYEVEITNGGATKTYTVTGTSYTLKFLTGAISYKVTAKAHGFNSSVKSGSYNKTTIASPSNLKIVNDKLSWDAVDDAVKYVVSVNGTEIDANDPWLSTNDPVFSGAVGTKYTIYVTAIADTAAKNSLPSDMFEATSGVMGAVSYENGKVSWGGVIGAVKYGVKVNDGAEVIVDDANELAVTLTKKGTNVISVRCYTDNTNTSAWVSVNVTAFEIKIDANEGYSIDGASATSLTYYLADGDVLTLPLTAERTGYEFSGWYTTRGGAADNTAQKYGATATFTEDTTVYAYWVGRKYTVTLVPTGGVIPDVTLNDQNNYELKVTFGSAFELPTPDSDSGTLAFVGWYSEYNNSGSIRYTDEDGNGISTWNIANNDAVLYPVWADIFSFAKETDAATKQEYYVVSSLPAIVKVRRARVPAMYEGLPVLKVEADCFKNCKTLKIVELPDTLNEISLGEYGYSAAGSAFFGCQILEEINMYHVAGNTDVKYFSKDGILYRRMSETGSEAEIIYCPYGITDTLTIAKTVGGEVDGDNIGEYTVTTISVNVLEGSHFKKVYIPSTVTTISEKAFYKNTVLSAVVFQATDEGEDASPLNIDAGAFEGCLNIETVTFPKRLSSFNRDMFNVASKLLTVYVSDEEGVDGVGTYFASVNGVLTNAAQNTIVFVGRGVGGEVDNPDGEFVIPAGITTIGAHAFQQCTKIKKLTIPAYVTMIEEKAFMQCNNIAELIFEGDEYSEDLTIGEYAFCSFSVDVKPSTGLTTSFNTSLKMVTLPANLKTLGRSAFGGCRFTEVVVNCNRTEVNYSNNAVDVDITEPFLQRTYSYVKKVTLGKDCPTFSVGGVFGASIEEVIVHDDNPYYHAEDGVLYNKTVTEILYFPVGKGGEFKIPETVTTIGDGVFAERKELTKIVIPGSVTYIGKEAFYNCTKLGAIEFEDGIEPLVIDDDAFRLLGSRDLTKIEVPARCVSIGNGAFRQISYLEEIVLHEGLETIGDYAFYLCYELKEITIPASVTKIGAYDSDGNLSSIINVFSMYLTSAKGALKAINIAAGNTSFASHDGVLYLLTKASEEAEAKATDLLVCPAGKEGNVEILATTKRVWAYAFQGTTKVTEVSFEDGFDSEGFAFDDNVFTNSSVTKIELPEGLDSIGEGMFKNCSLLEEIVIPSTVSFIGKAAFANCTNLSRLTFAETPENQKSVPLVFDDCATYTLSSTGTGSPTGTSSAITYNCKSLKKLELPERTTRIGDYAFCGYYASNNSGAPTDYPNYLEEVVIPSTVTYIGNMAFYRNTKLTKVTFTDADTAPETGTLTIADYAFNSCALAGTQVVKDGATLYELQLPNTLKSIGNYVFNLNCKFTAVSIPKNLETIGNSAFASMSSLTQVTIEKDSKLTSIGNSAFTSNSGLVRFDFVNAVSLTTIGTSAFNGCSKLASCDLSNTQVTDIGARAFNNCKAIQTVSLPATIINIGDAAQGTANPTNANYGETFYGCSALTAVTFNTRDYKLDAEGNIIKDGESTEVAKTEGRSDLTFVGYHSFANTGLINFSFPISTSSSIAIAGGYQFEGCKSLTKIELSRSVTNIANLFAKCTSIEQIIIAEDSGSFKTSTDSNIPFILGVNGDEIVYGYAAVPTTKAGTYDLSQTSFTRIGTRAFEGQSNIKKIILPATLQQIDDYAFANCRMLEEVVFADGSVIRTIGAYAFDGCSSLKSVSLPNSVQTIGAYAFSRCVNITSVQIGTSSATQLQEIGQYAFEACTRIRTAEIYCGTSTYLGTASSASYAELYRDSYMFRFCYALETVIIHGTPNMGLGGYMFQYCTSLRTVIVDDGLSQIGRYAFSGCTALKTMKVFKGSETDPEKASGADNVITLPSGLTKLGNITSTSTSSQYYNGYVFQNCTSITKVVLPEGSTTQKLNIGTYSFSGATSLATVTYVDGETSEEACEEGELLLPTSVKMIGYHAFENTAIEVAKLENLGNITTNHYSGFSSYELHNLFQNCTALTKVTFSNKVTTLYTSMFAGCSELATLNYYDEDKNRYVGDEDEATFWEGLTNLGTSTSAGTFQGCAFTKVIFPESLKTIWTSDSKTSVTAATNTNSYTFKDCTSLTTIVMTRYLYAIAGSVFDGCTSLNRIIMAGEEESEEESEADDELEATAEGDTESEEVVMVIPNTLVIINPKAFQNIGATKIVFEAGFVNPKNNDSTVTGVTERKFYTSSSSIFAGCTKLEEVEYNWTTMCTNMFEGCSKLTTVTLSNNLTALASNVFASCTNLTRVIISEKLTTLAASAFSGCESLARIDVMLEDGTMDLDNGVGHANLKYINALQGTAFKGCAFAKVTLKSSVTALAANTFEGCSNLRTIFVDGDENNETGAANLTKISTSASSTFLNCTSLTKIILKNGAISFSSSKETFKGCTNLATIYTLGDDDNNQVGRANLSKITTAGTSNSYGGQFSGCAFEEVYIPALTTGGYTMFMECTKLTTVTISANLINLNFGMFDGCEKLKTVYTNGDTANNEVGTANLSKITRLTTTATGTTVASYSFRGTAIEKVNLSSLSVITTLTLGTFENCEKLKEVILNENLTILGNNMFAGCTSLTTFHIGENIATIGTNAFANCAKLTAFTVAEGNTSFTEIDGAIYTADGSVLVAFPVGYEGEFVLADGAVGAQAGALAGYHGTTKSFTLPVMEDIPAMAAMLEGSGIETLIIPEGVVTIADSAFAGVTSLKTVIIPSTVTTIGKAAFGNCTALETVTFSAAPEGVDEVPLTITAGSSGTAAANLGAFGNCTALKNFVIPERLTVVSNYMFYGSGVENVTFHEKLTTIGNYAFAACASLKTVDIPNGVTDIGYNITSTSTSTYSFQNSGLETIILPGTLEKLGQYSFSSCAALTTIKYHDAETGEVIGADGDLTLPKGLQVLCGYTFERCTSLNPAKISIYVAEEGPISGEQDVGAGLFRYCSGLTNVVFETNLTKISNSMFLDCTSLTTLEYKSDFTYLGTSAFENCSSLKAFKISDKCTEFGGSKIFANCTSLEELVIPSSVTTATGSAISSSTSSLNSVGWFVNWTAEQKIIIEVESLEMLNWTGCWYSNSEAQIIYRRADGTVYTDTDE